MIQVIWDLDLSVFKAKISTSATGQVEDKLWITDNTHGLPMSAREREIRGTISATIGPGAECMVIPVEKELTSSRSAMLSMNESQAIGSACGLRRQCKDSASHSNLRFLTNKYSTNTINNNSGNLHYYTSSSSVGGSRGSSHHGGSQHGGSLHLLGGAGGIACIDENNNNQAGPKEEEEEEGSLHYHHHHPAEQQRHLLSNEHTLSSADRSPRSSDEASEEHEDHFYHNLSDSIINTTTDNTDFLTSCALNTGFTGAEFIAAAAADSAVEVSVENDTSAAFTLITLRCNDRKGLLYDIMRSLKDMDVRIGFGRLEAVLQDGVDADTGNKMVEADLFVQDAQSGKILEETMLKILVDRVRVAISRPYQLMISIKKKQHRKGKSVGTEIAAAATLHNSATATRSNNNKSTDLLEVTVITELDAGGRGRPRVTYDVTRGLDQAQFGVVSAEIFVNEIEHGRRDTYCHGVEVHQFLVESLHDYETAAAGEDIEQEQVKCTDTVNNQKREEEGRLMMMNKKISSLRNAINGQLLGSENRDSMYSYNKRKKNRVE